MAGSGIVEAAPLIRDHDDVHDTTLPERLAPFPGNPYPRRCRTRRGWANPLRPSPPTETMTTSELLRIGPDRLQLDRWNDERRTVVVRSASPDGPPSVDTLRQALELLHRRGIAQVTTPALDDAAQAPYLAAGFVVRDQLHLLRHGLQDLARPTTVRTRRGRGGHDLRRAAEIDHLAFPPDWWLDATGLQGALRATPVARFRFVDQQAYAISGAAGNRGVPPAGRGGPGRASPGYRQRARPGRPAMDAPTRRHACGREHAAGEPRGAGAVPRARVRAHAHGPRGARPRLRGTGGPHVSPWSAACVRVVLPLLVAVGAATVAGASASPVRGAAPVGIRLRSSTLWVAPKDAVVTTVTLSGVPAGASLHTTLHGAVPTRSAYALAAKGQNVTAEIHAFPDQDLRAGATSASVRFRSPTARAPPPQTTPSPSHAPACTPCRSRCATRRAPRSATLNTFLVRLGAGARHGRDAEPEAAPRRDGAAPRHAAVARCPRRGGPQHDHPAARRTPRRRD